MSLALWTIRVARRLPLSRIFERHLDRCAALAIVYAEELEHLGGIRVSHVLGIRDLPDPLYSLRRTQGERISAPVLASDVGACGHTPPVVDGVVSQGIPQSIH